MGFYRMNPVKAHFFMERERKKCEKKCGNTVKISAE